MIVRVSDPWLQVKQRENDVFIMDKVCASSYPSHILERLNDVHLWLKVSMLSDMVNQEGTQLEEWALYSPPKERMLQWLKRRQPLASNLKLWCDTLRQEFCAGQGL